MTVSSFSGSWEGFPLCGNDYNLSGTFTLIDIFNNVVDA
jgi:hypothetical protein